MQFMKKDHIYNNEAIVDGNFQIESISAAHRYIDPTHTYTRYATEHKNDRIIYIVNGKMKLDMYNNRPIVAKKGDTIYVPYNIAYKSEWIDGEEGEIFSINYLMTDLAGYQITMYPEIHRFENCDSGIMAGLFAKCYVTFSRAEHAYLLKCKYILLKLIYTICTLESEYNNSRIGKAIKYIDINYLGEINISELAKMCNLGECMFRRCFKEETGTSPTKYRNRLRINRAYEMLTQTNCSVAEAMEVTGFYDASYFNKTFKLYTGKTPSECKMKLK
ncbi:MAG: helix-turn-helix domain-containing protein [Clostridia bacterium]|nr:helix-turn-helix domain-containing protein [Clostridia bacterium]